MASTVSQALLEAGNTIQESTQARHRYLAVQKDHEEAKETQGESKRRATVLVRRARGPQLPLHFLRLRQCLMRVRLSFHVGSWTKY